MRTLLTRSIIGICAVTLVASVAPATAATVFQLDICSKADICTNGVSQGSVTLTQNGSNEVDVSVELATGVLLVNTGGPHTPFVFNLAPAVANATVTITSVNNPTFFTPDPNPSETPYGDFTNGIGYNGTQGGVGHGSPGPLTFSVYYVLGITIADFVTNAGGYRFAADVLGNLGGTGGVAAINGTESQDTLTTPLPGAFSLFAGGLGLLGLLGRRRKRTAPA